MNRLAAMLLLAVVPAAFADAAAAAEPAAAPAPADTATATAPAAVDGEAPATDPDADVVVRAADAERSARRNCIRETGTLLPNRDADGCTALPGESYDREDIDRTGATDTADALRRLSPSVTIRR